MSRFTNPNYSPTPPAGQTFWGGMPVPDTMGLPPGAHPGHGHDGRTFRPPVADFLGNAALGGAGVKIDFGNLGTPRW